jgi:ADP-heptose:LPS heptosyltransferase
MKIIILPLYGIGDVLMTTPALRNIKEQLDAEITYLHMFRTTKDILSYNPYVDKNIFLPFLELSKLRGLRFLFGLRNNYDCSINFYPSNRKQYNLAAFLVSSEIRIGHRYMIDDLSELNFLKNRTVQEDDSLHNVEENLRLLEFLGIKDRKAYPLEIYLTEEEKLFAHQWLRERKIDDKILIGIHPGTSIFKNHDKRRWPEASFAKLIDRLDLEMKKCIFLLFGGPEEESLRSTVISMVHDQKKVLPVYSVSVRQTASLMKNCRLCISNDSGPMHIAAAVGVPTVAIFGPTNSVWVKPWGTKHKIVRSELPCSPCFRYSPRPLRCVANLDYACLKNISVDQVYDACIELFINASLV